ncbi:unnamed protein product [Dicrocoelium dendriticum]|nr:unnamed protein product [Dicrocoelium dendriticum]
MDMLPTVSPKAHDPSNIFADLRIPPQRIILKRLVMKGTFGRLYEAKLRVRTRRNSRQFVRWKTVFVKTVSAYATHEQIEVFLKDASKLASIRNRRITSVIATTQQDSALNGAISRVIPWLVYPHAELGNLKHFLRTPTRSSNENMSTKGLTADQIVILGLQIVQAVEYLHHNGIVHGDVATRNCLLRSQVCVTLCDSALSRDFFPEDYQCLGDNTNRPIKWLALEALVGRTFSRATDVWSVGVTLWELVTKGQQPYSLFDPFEMPNILRSGYRLEQPSNCPEEIVQLPEQKLSEAYTSCIRDMKILIHRTKSYFTGTVRSM